jgi:hypothetical protein
MRNPRDSRRGKKAKVPALPPGGGAAARARQFALEHGLETDQQKTGRAASRPRKSPAKKSKT